ncbi:MAG: hypothetical protein R3C52_06015 [Hyphomonadaceae bacterium]
MDRDTSIMADTITRRARQEYGDIRGGLHFVIGAGRTPPGGASSGAASRP